MKKRSLNFLLACFAILIISGTSRAEIFTAYLSSAQEVPTNASTATGYARVNLNEAAGTITFTVVFTGLSSSQTASHIHAPAAIGANIGVAIDFGGVGGTSGTISGTRSITPTQIAQLRQHLGYVNVHSANLPGGEIRGQLGVARPLDYDGDGRTDPAVIKFNNVAGIDPMSFWIRGSTSGLQVISPFGNWNTDDPAAGDWDGDGLADIATVRLFRPAPAKVEFWIAESSTNNTNFRFYDWGIAGDAPVQRDYDGDGKTDTAVYRLDGTWFILRSATNTVRIIRFGLGGDPDIFEYDYPIPGDYDGDGKFDIAIYRAGTSPANTIVVERSSDGIVTWEQFGNFDTDYIVPGDFDGDGKYEVAAARVGGTASTPMNWWIRASSTGAISVTRFGLSSDIPVQGDYDGDARTDIAVFRNGATTGAQTFFWVIPSLTGFATIQAIPWGARPDWPINRFDIR